MNTNAAVENNARMVARTTCLTCASRANEDDAVHCPECGQSGTRLSEPFFDTRDVEDDEVEPVAFAFFETMLPPALPGMRLSRESRADLTLTVTDEEVERVSFARIELDIPPRALTPRRTALGDADPLLGRVVAGEYRLLALLGRGGMGAVYKVEHMPSGTLRAMKLLSGELAAQHDVVQRFRQEAWATQHLSHPNTVQVFDFGESDQLVYVVMEYLEGCDLATLIRSEQRLSFERVAKLAVQIAESVSEAHELGIIHCDIKPENVFVLSGEGQDDERVKVLDFGIAQLRDVDEPVEAEHAPLFGTPYYMAPEQILRGRVDARTDVYALGALLYKSLTGTAPFSADTPMAVLDKHLSEPLTPMRERVPGLVLSDAAERVVQRALSKDPTERQASMKALADELVACLAVAETPDACLAVAETPDACLAVAETPDHGEPRPDAKSAADAEVHRADAIEPPQEEAKGRSRPRKKCRRSRARS